MGSYAGVLALAWFEARNHAALMAGLGGHFAYAFVSLAWLLAPLWFFGFGAGEWLRNSLRSQSLRVVLPALLGIPYLVSAIPARDVHGGLLIPLFLLPVTLAALGERAGSSKLIWRMGLCWPR